MYDVVVLGLGGMGSATLYHLAREGTKVLGVEQFGIPHSLGSSHGSTRIIRLAYSEGSEYVPLLRAAYRNWKDLEVVSDRHILHRTGGLDIGPVASWTIEGSRKSCLHHGLEFEEMDSRGVTRRFPGYRLPPSLRAIYQPDAGYLLSETAIEAYVDTARMLGADVMTNVEVLRWDHQHPGITVHTSRGDFTCKRLVVTAGPWTGHLLPGLHEYCRPERQVMLWTDPRNRSVFTPDRFPVFNMETPRGRFYGLPDHRSEGFKIGKYHHREEAVRSPADLDRTCRATDEAVLRDGLREYFPQADGPTKRSAVCMFTNTPDSDFIIDRCPGEDDVYIAAGFSGHGFKFCSVIGRVLLELCLDLQLSWDIGRFRLSAVRTNCWSRSSD